MTKLPRKTALTILRVAGYHGDRRSWMRAYIENRVSLPVANEQWRLGQDEKAAGVKCGCFECREAGN